MHQAPGARFGHNRIEHQQDLARRSWSSQQRGRGHLAAGAGDGELVRSVIALIVGLVVIAGVVVLAWQAGVFDSP
jgi:hypothetical protein